MLDSVDDLPFREARLMSSEELDLLPGHFEDDGFHQRRGLAGAELGVKILDFDALVGCVLVY